MLGDDFMRLLFGLKYSDGATLVGFYSLVMFPLALILIIENYLLALGTALYAWIILAALPIEIFIIGTLNLTIVECLAVFGVINYAVLVVGGFVFFRNSKASKISA